MIMMFVCFLILFYAINLYNKGKRQKGLMVFFFFLTGGFHLLPETWMYGAPVNKYPDFALLYLIYVCVIRLLQKKFIFFSLKKELSCIRWIVFLLCYITIEFIATLLFKWEQFGYALAVYRGYLLLGSFILVRELKVEEIKKTLIQIGSITIFTTFLFIIQPIIGVKLLHHAGIGADAAESLGIARYRNIPYLAYFFLLYSTIKLKMDNVKSIFALFVFGIGLLLTQHRGIMIGYFLSVVIYLFLSKQIKKTIQFGFVGILVWLLVGNYLSARFEQDDTTSDIKNVLSLDYKAAVYSGFSTEDGGTFSFRILLLLERFDYLFNNPEYLLTGVGCRHEDSPNTDKFDFYLGSNKRNRYTGLWEPCQLTSGDLVWLSPLMLFGILGLIVYIYITWLILKYFYDNRNYSSVAMSIFIFYILLIIISFKNDHLFANLQMFLVYLFLYLIRKTKIIKPQEINENLNFNILKGV